MTFGPPHRTVDLVSALFLSLLATSACATTGVRPRPSSAVLRVDNHSWSDVVVYVADGNTPFRLGRVAALDRARLAIPAGAAHSRIRVLVRAADGHGVWAADTVAPGAGGVVDLRVEPLLEQSHVSLASYLPHDPMER